MSILLRLVAGPLFGKIVDLVESLATKNLKREEVEAKVKEALIKASSDIAPHQAEVLKTEITGENWLQRNWRPCVASTSAFILFFYALILPIAVDWFGLPPVRVGNELLGWIMQIVVITLGGYIGGRSIEKVARTLKG